MIGTLRRMLSSAFGRHEATGDPAPARGRSGGRGRDDAARRIDDARRRLRATIPPPESED